MSDLITGDAREILVEAFWVRVYASGPIERARDLLRRDCLREGLCVTIEPTRFIYTGGEEQGYCVGFINYPRFPLSSEKLWERAVFIAKLLLDQTYQLSILVMSAEKTLWITKRQE